MPDIATIIDIPRSSLLRDEKFIDYVKSAASDYGHKLTDATVKTDEKDNRTLTLKFERSVSGQEELPLSTEREPDDVPDDEPKVPQG